MKTMRVAALFLCLCLLFGLLGAGSAFADTAKGKTETGKTEAAKADAPKKEVPVEGEYTLFGARYDGITVDSKALGIESVLILEKGGKGSMSMDEDVVQIESWEMKDGELSITVDDGSAAKGRCGDGIAALDLYEDGSLLLYYAKEGVDLSEYKLLNKEEALAAYNAAHADPDSRLYKLWSALDAEKGVHLNYELYVESMDALQEYDVHCKDGVFYSSRTTKAMGFEGTVVTICKDGEVLNLYPKDKTGNFVMEMNFQVLKDNPLLMDKLYSLINGRVKELNYTTEEREFDGGKLEAEVYPTDGVYLPEDVFFYDKDGKLVGCINGAPVKDTMEIGDLVYTIKVIDDKVDESLFDISGYTIERDN